MILVTVGTQLPFDRLIRAVEQWGEEHGYTDIIFQIGRSAYKPSLGTVIDFIPAQKLDELQRQAELVIGHAGIGTIISRLSLKKPVVIMPRLHALNEHRNDHQKATIARLRHLPGVFTADTEQDLSSTIEHARKAINRTDIFNFPSHADDSLTSYIRHSVL